MRARKLPLAIKLVYVLGSTLLLSGLVLAIIQTRPLSPTDLIPLLERDYSVAVHIDAPSTHKTTLEHQEQTVLRMGKPTGESLPVAINGLKRALGFYPPELIEEYLTSIHLVSNLQVQGIEAAGSFSVSNRAVYIRADDQTAPYGEEFYAETFHHEFSSLLVYLSDFPVEAWKAATPAGFRYQYDWQGFAQGPQHDEDIETKERLAKGFLTQHAMTRLDDDVNAYAEKLFEHPEELIALAQEFPAIRQKACLLIGFYMQQAESMSATFSEHYPDSWCNQVGG